MIKLLEKQENKRFSDLRKSFEDNSNLTPNNKMKKLKFHRDVEEYKDLYPIKKALSFLSISDQPINLLLVNKRWRLLLINKISKMYLLKFHNEDILKNLRVQLWFIFSNSEVCIDYFFKIIN